MKANFSLYEVLQDIYYRAEEGFEIGDYAVIVAGMFDGIEGPVHYVDNEGRWIELQAGVSCGFGRAFNVTRFPEFLHHSKRYAKWRKP